MKFNKGLLAAAALIIWSLVGAVGPLAESSTDTATIIQHLRSIRQIFDSMSVETAYEGLIKRDLPELYALKSLPDPCSRTDRVLCGLANNEQVRPAIDMAIEYKKLEIAEAAARKTANDASFSRAIAIGGLCISFLSLGVSALSFRQKAKEGKLSPADEGPA